MHLKEVIHRDPRSCCGQLNLAPHGRSGRCWLLPSHKDEVQLRQAWLAFCHRLSNSTILFRFGSILNRLNLFAWGDSIVSNISKSFSFVDPVAFSGHATGWKTSARRLAQRRCEALRWVVPRYVAWDVGVSINGGIPNSWMVYNQWKITI